jgi:hypothetical protein
MPRKRFLGESSKSFGALNFSNGEDGLGVDEAGVAEVVEAALREDLGASLEPGHVVGGLERLGDDAARGAEHDPASVDRC